MHNLRRLEYHLFHAFFLCPNAQLKGSYLPLKYRLCCCQVLQERGPKSMAWGKCNSQKTVNSPRQQAKDKNPKYRQSSFLKKTVRGRQNDPDKIQGKAKLRYRYGQNRQADEPGRSHTHKATYRKQAKTKPRTIRDQLTNKGEGGSLK